jgi:shikimate dehydrogenase
VALLGGRVPPVVVDLVYDPLETPLLRAARVAGAPAIDGLGMLVHQAAVAFESWTGVAPPLDVMRTAAGG